VSPRTFKALFDNPRQSSVRTSGDYDERQLEKMVADLFSLKGDARFTYFQGLKLSYGRDVLERLRRWPKAEAVRVLLEESERCLKKASAPHGAACVAGKALDLLLHLLGLDLQGTLGRKLRELTEISRRDAERIDADRSRPLVTELLKMWDYLETRNSAAHYRTNRPEISMQEATEFTQKVIQLYELEKNRQSLLAKELELRTRGKRLG